MPRTTAAVPLGLPIGYVGVVDKDHGVVEVRYPEGAVVLSRR
ncbi:hypothetical protein [Streptomyces sp. NPDC005012]